MHPWFAAAGAAAVALPLAIHFLTRPRPRRMRLSTIRFVREAMRGRAARSRLRDAVVLALRAAALLLLGWTFARPLPADRALVSPGAEAAAVRAVVLDCSQSMAARAGGSTAFERGRAVAARHLAAPPG